MKNIIVLLLFYCSICYAQNQEIKQLQIDTVNLGGKHIKPKQITTNTLTLYDDSSIATAKKLYFDGGGDTYISEVATNNLGIYCGGNLMWQIDNANSYINTGSLIIPSTNKLYFDGVLGDTYIYESSANTLKCYAGGQAIWNANSLPQMEIYANVYADLEVSAQSFVDRTPYPQTTQQAYDAVNSVKLKADKSGVDHEALNSFIKKGNGRDLSALVSSQNEVIKDLIKRIETLEKK